MKTSVNMYEFVKAFDDHGRSDNFTREGRKVLYEWFEQYEDDCGEEIDLDVIAICCDFEEYKNIEEFWTEHNKEDYPTFDAIRENTTVIEIDESAFIIQAF